MKAMSKKPLDLKKMLGTDSVQKQILNKIMYIDKQLNCNYIFKTITIDKWEKKYKPLILKMVDNPICDGDYNKLLNYLKIIELDLISNENVSMNKLENFILEDFGTNILEDNLNKRKPLPSGDIIGKRETGWGIS